MPPCVLSTCSVIGSRALGFQGSNVARKHLDRNFRRCAAGYGDGLCIQGLEDPVHQGFGVPLGPCAGPGQHHFLTAGLQLGRAGVVDQPVQNKGELDDLTGEVPRHWRVDLNRNVAQPIDCTGALAGDVVV